MTAEEADRLDSEDIARRLADYRQSGADPNRAEEERKRLEWREREDERKAPVRLAWAIQVWVGVFVVLIGAGARSPGVFIVGLIQVAIGMAGGWSQRDRN